MADTVPRRHTAKAIGHFQRWHLPHLVLLDQAKTPVKRPHCGRKWKGFPATRQEVKDHEGLFGLVPASTGLLAYDVDEGGQAAVDALERHHGKPVAVVPSKQPGRFHAYFLWDGESAGNGDWSLPEGSGQIRCEKGYVALHPGTARVLHLELVKLQVSDSLRSRYRRVSPNSLPKPATKDPVSPSTATEGVEAPQSTCDGVDGVTALGWPPRYSFATEQRHCELLRQLRRLLGRKSNWHRGTKFAIEKAFQLFNRFEKNDDPSANAFPPSEIERVARQAVRYRDSDLESGELERRWSIKQSWRGRLGGIASGRSRRACPKRLKRVTISRTLRGVGLSYRGVGRACGSAVSTAWRDCKGVDSGSLVERVFHEANILAPSPLPPNKTEGGSPKPPAQSLIKSKFTEKQYGKGMKPDKFERGNFPERGVLTFLETRT